MIHFIYLVIVSNCNKWSCVQQLSLHQAQVCLGFFDFSGTDLELLHNRTITFSRENIHRSMKGEKSRCTACTIIENHYHYYRLYACTLYTLMPGIVIIISLKCRKPFLPLNFFFLLLRSAAIKLSNTDGRQFFTYIIIYMFIVMSTDFVYANSLGCNWMMTGTFVNGPIAMRIKIVTCILIVLIDWKSKCGTVYGRYKNDELKDKNKSKTNIIGWQNFIIPVLYNNHAKIKSKTKQQLRIGMDALKVTFETSIFCRIIFIKWKETTANNNNRLIYEIYPTY